MPKKPSKDQPKEIRRLLAWYKRLNQVHVQYFEALVAAREAIRGGNLTKEDLVDCCYVIRESAALVEDMRKESNGLLELFTKIACVLWVQESINDNDESPDPIRGKLATGTPDIGKMASIPHPKREPEAWLALLKHFGLTEEQGTFFRLHWPTMTEHITQLTEQGAPLPPGIDPSKTYDRYQLKPLRKNRGLDLGAESEAAYEQEVADAKKRKKA